ncbi:hypothetical protein PIB30_059617 [Stylosanthes scabra]|uniref:Uncharacterized protein n=1 Tax=Stylosanthes scabra TaxID=79078 RepID=A0ABU6RKM7_9FABA|nr:hypothetical protein [Stylosanthes scabra]
MLSEELLYCINKNATRWEWCQGGANVRSSSEEGNFAVNLIVRVDVASHDDEEFNDETLYRIDVNEVERVGEVARNASRKESEQWGEEDENDDIEASCEEDNFFEVVEARKVWDKGGISFYRSDEEEVLAKLSERKIVGKKRADLLQKKQKQGRKAPCLQGRTLATRKLRLISKTKLK